MEVRRKIEFKPIFEIVTDRSMVDSTYSLEEAISKAVERIRSKKSKIAWINQKLYTGDVGIVILSDDFFNKLATGKI